MTIMDRYKVLVMVASLILLQPAAAQMSPYTSKDIPPPAKKAARVQITEGPSLEIFRNNEAIIRWTSNNPGGSDEHFGVVHYGKSATDQSQTAKSHVRLNQGHKYTVFRVRVEALEAHTTYYYKVDSEAADGTSDGVNSALKTFTTP